MSFCLGGCWNPAPLGGGGCSLSETRQPMHLCTHRAAQWHPVKPPLRGGVWVLACASDSPASLCVRPLWVWWAGHRALPSGHACFKGRTQVGGRCACCCVPPSLAVVWCRLGPLPPHRGLLQFPPRRCADLSPALALPPKPFGSGGCLAELRSLHSWSRSWAGCTPDAPRVWVPGARTP